MYEYALSYMSYPFAWVNRDKDNEGYLKIVPPVINKTLNREVIIVLIATLWIRWGSLHWDKTEEIVPLQWEKWVHCAGKMGGQDGETETEKSRKHGKQRGNSCVGAEECQATMPWMRGVRVSCTLHWTRVDIALIWKLVAVVVLYNWDKDVSRHNRQRGDLDQIHLQKAYGEFKTFLVKWMCISGKPGSTGSQSPSSASQCQVIPGGQVSDGALPGFTGGFVEEEWHPGIIFMNMRETPSLLKNSNGLC